MKATKILLLVSLICIVGCQPSVQAIQTALAQTQAAMPTATITKISLINTPLSTQTPHPTATVTVLPTSTPDVRVIDVDPRKLLLQKEDLPTEGEYILPSGWTSPLTNAEIVAEWTVEEGKSYLAETGRVHGWITDYYRNTNNVVLPEEVYDNAVLYSNPSGAQLLITKYGITEGEEGYKEIDASQIGDLSRAYQKTETDASGQTREWLRITFVYRNVYHQLVFWGWDQDVTLDFAIKVANRLLEDLKQLPLSDSVTFQP